MTNTIERVMRSAMSEVSLMASSLRTYPVKPFDFDKEVIGETREYLKALVIGVFNAMREPSEAMIEAGWYSQAVGYTAMVDIKNIWRAMIDAALKETDDALQGL